MMNKQNKISALSEIICELDVIVTKLHQLQYKGIKENENESNIIMVRRVMNDLREQREILRNENI